MAVHILNGASLTKIHEIALKAAISEGNKTKSGNISKLSAKSNYSGKLLHKSYDSSSRQILPQLNEQQA